MHMYTHTKNCASQSLLFLRLETVLPCFLHTAFSALFWTGTAFLTPHFLDTFTATSASSSRDLWEKDAVLQNQSGCNPWINPLLPTQISNTKTWIKCSMHSLVSFSCYFYKSDKYVFRNRRIKHFKHWRDRKQPGLKTYINSWKFYTPLLCSLQLLYYYLSFLLQICHAPRWEISLLHLKVHFGRQCTKYLRKLIWLCQLSSLLT